MTVTKVDIVGDRAKRVRRILGRSVKNVIANHGDNLAGFALVAWDMRGSASSAFLAAGGPVGEALMPSFVKDQLSRHVAVSLATDEMSKDVSGE